MYVRTYVNISNFRGWGSENPHESVIAKLKVRCVCYRDM
jgi:hypothetical protein